MDYLFDDAAILRPTTVEVDLGALQRNVRSIRSLTGSALMMGIVKANAYGHGLVEVARALVSYGVEQLGVAFLEEGIALRKEGITVPILVLGGIIGNQIEYFLRYDLMITASSPFKLRQIEEVAALTGQRARVHLKIDTGMARIGIQYANADKLFEAALEAQHCELCGVFSHFAASDSDDPAFTHLQLARFAQAMEFFPRHGLPMPLRHMANAGAVLQHPDATFDMVRPGIITYGVYPSATVARTIPLEPVMSFKTRVVYFKVVKEGVPVGYDGTWVAPRDTRVVTLPVGYGDGYRRGLSNRAQVLIHGKRYPIVGNISMDQLTVDIGQNSAYNGDEATLIGAQDGELITCEELAAMLDTNPYEVLTGINTRVPRVYKNAPVAVKHADA